MPSQDPLPHSLLGERSFLRLRRKSDKVWFGVTVSCFLFSVAVFTYKLKFEAPDVIEIPASRENAAPAPAPSEPKAALPPAEDVKETPRHEALPVKKPEIEAKAPPPVERPKPAEKPKAVEKPKPKEVPPPPAAAKKKEPPKPAASGVLTLDSCDSTDGWLPAQDKDTTFNLGLEPGHQGKALTLNLEWKGDKWVAVRKSFPVTITHQGAFLFYLRKEGAIDKIEFKIADKDGSHFGKTYQAPAFTGEWKEFRLPVADLHYLWGGDPVLNMDAIQGMDIAVSGPNSRGKVFLDELRYQK